MGFTRWIVGAAAIGCNGGTTPTGATGDTGDTDIVASVPAPEVRWTLPAARPDGRSCPVVSPDGATVLVNHLAVQPDPVIRAAPLPLGTLAVDAQTGAVSWSAALIDPYAIVEVWLATDGDTVALSHQPAGGSSGSAALDAATGAIRFTVDPAVGWAPDGFTADGTVVAHEGFRVVGRDPVDGAERFALDRPATGMGVAAGLGLGFRDADVTLVPPETVAVELATGAEVWRMPWVQPGSVFAVDGRLWPLDLSSTLTARDPATGAVDFTVALPDPTSKPPSIADGIGVAWSPDPPAIDSPVLTAFDAATGQVLWTADPDDPAFAAYSGWFGSPLAVDGVVVTWLGAGGAGVLLGLSADDGAILWALPRDTGPDCLASAGDLVIAASAGEVYAVVP